MTADQPVSSSSDPVDYQQVLSVWVVDESARLLFADFNELVRSRLSPAGVRTDADFQFIDWRKGAQPDDLLADTDSPLADALTQDQSDDQLLPALVVVDDHTDLSSCFELSDGIDFSFIEVINVSELNTTVLDIRIKKLLQVTAKQACQKLVRDNTEIILDAVMKYSNDWMVVKSLDHRFLRVSGKFSSTYGKSAEELLGKNDLDIGTSPELVRGKPGTDWKGYWALDDEVTDSGEPQISQPLLLDEDLNIHESMDKVPLRDCDGNVFALLVCVFRFVREKNVDTLDDAIARNDVRSTYLWEHKDSLPHNPALFTMSNERRRAEELKTESERAIIAKNRFIATASHDLRQPLHAIGLYVGALEDTVENDAAGLVAKLKTCVGSLNELLTSLLDISRLDANVESVQKTDFPVAELLLSLQSEHSASARDKSLDIICSADGSIVHTDPVLFRRIVRNLLSNAINQTISGRITLTTRRIGNRVEVVVADTGVGIPEDKQELVFEEFAKLEKDSRARDTQQGLGLGLSIVKRLCLLLDIGIRLDSQVDRGTRIYLTVPLGQSLLEQGAVEDTGESRGGDKADSIKLAAPRKNVLVIDDDETVCDAVKTILEHYGYRVVSASTTQTAIDKLNNSSLIPDVVVVDFRLSDEMTGLTAIEIVSTHLGYPIPALIVTGDTTDIGLREITRSGYRHLHKPVDTSELLQLIDEAVNQALPVL